MFYISLFTHQGKKQVQRAQKVTPLHIFLSGYSHIKNGHFSISAFPLFEKKEPKRKLQGSSKRVDSQIPVYNTTTTTNKHKKIGLLKQFKAGQECKLWLDSYILCSNCFTKLNFNLIIKVVSGLRWLQLSIALTLEAHNDTH